MKAVSNFRQRFGEHIDNCLFIFVLFLVAFGFLLGALGVVVMFSDGTAIYLQQLLGLSEESEKLREKYGVLKAIGFCIVGILLVLQALTANKRAKAMENAANEQAKATANTEAGQRQERLKNAIEHLGHDRDSVRMGGAYELFHLAEDTEKLRQTVMDILCAHIRQTTTGQTTRGKDYQEEHKTKPSEEIQSLLTLLFTQKHGVFEDCSINLQGSYLNGATLSLARLRKANLRQMQLQEANLRYAHLQEANLMEAQLQGAVLMEAQLQGADLRRAQLQKTGIEAWEDDMQRTNQPHDPNLRQARLQGANLSKAQLQGAFLSGSKLQGAILREAKLQGAALWQTQMQGADLEHVQLQGANLNLAKLQGADLRAAQLQGVSSQAGSIPLADFESRISDRIGKDSDLDRIIFADGLQQENLNTLCEGLSVEKAQVLREKLRPHVGPPASTKLPRDSGAETGAYTQKEADQWIAEYNEAMSEAPR